MKKIVVTLVAVAVSLPMVVMGASNFTSSFKDGKYNLAISSVLPDLNNKKGTAEVKHEGNQVVATVNYDGGQEVWKWDDKTLTQEEIDLKTNKTVDKYGATAEREPTATSQTYNINCKNKATNDCEAGVDARNKWTLEAVNAGFKYSYTGVAKADKGKMDVPVAKRFEFNFTQATVPAAK